MTKFYGLTGGIGSGKSTVAKMFSEFSVPVLDLDTVGKQLLGQTNIIQQLTECFGSTILDSNQTINKKKLAKIAFSNNTNTQKLNSITHPAIKQFESDWRKQQSSPMAIIEASVLIESGDIKRMDSLIVVLCDHHIRKERVLKRGNQDAAAFEVIVERQCTDTQREKAANHIISNTGNISELRTQVHNLYHSIIQS